MGIFTEEITLTNVVERSNAKRGLIPEDQVHSITV
jgi:hypothetical protein